MGISNPGRASLNICRTYIKSVGNIPHPEGIDSALALLTHCCKGECSWGAWGLFLRGSQKGLTGSGLVLSDFEESLRKWDFVNDWILSGNRHNVIFGSLNSYLENEKRVESNSYR